jgi:glycosyltransferase involved in cell wall biosynthesis
MTNRAHVRVLFFTTHLGSGGAEMQALRMANHLDQSRFQVRIAVMRGGGTYEATLSEDVPLHVLGGSTPIGTTMALRRLIKRHKPDVVCSFLEYPMLVAGWASIGLRRRPHLVSCAQIPPSINWSGGGRRRIARALISRSYARAECIIALSQGVADDVDRFAPGARSRTTVVFNAGVDEQVESGAKEPLDPSEQRPKGPLVVACGRLQAQKGFPFLIDAFALVRQSFPDAQLWILGQGPDRSALEEQARAKLPDGCVRLLGFRENPYRYMAASDLFVLSSIFEGFGNVIVEAMACGAPVVSTDCPYGPSEIITEEMNGLLVPPADAPALAEAMSRVLADPDLADRLREGGQRRAQDFAAPVIASRYAEVFDGLLETEGSA